MPAGVDDSVVIYGLWTYSSIVSVGEDLGFKIEDDTFFIKLFNDFLVEILNS